MQLLSRFISLWKILASANGRQNIQPLDRTKFPNRQPIITAKSSWMYFFLCLGEKKKQTLDARFGILEHKTDWS